MGKRIIYISGLSGILYPVSTGELLWYIRFYKRLTTHLKLWPTNVNDIRFTLRYQLRITYSWLHNYNTDFVDVAGCPGGSLGSTNFVAIIGSVVLYYTLFELLFLIGGLFPFKNNHNFDSGLCIKVINCWMFGWKFKFKVSFCYLIGHMKGSSKYFDRRRLEVT